MKNLILLPIFLSAFALSFFLAPTSQKPTSEKAPPIQKSTRSHSNSNRPATPLLAQQINALPTHEERVRQVIALASSLPLDQIKTWRENAFLDSLDDDLEHLFKTITSNRWLEAAPEEFFDWYRQTEARRYEFHFGQFAVQDPEAALAYAKTLPGNDHDISYRLVNIFHALVKSDPSLALRLANQNLDQLLPRQYYGQNLLASLAKANPQEFIALRETWPEHHQSASAPSLASALLQSDFQSGLDFLQSENLGVSEFLRSLQFGSAKKSLVPNLDQLPPGWLKKIIDSPSYILAHAQDISIFDYDANRLDLDDESFEKLLTAASDTAFPKANRPRLLEILNNESLPTEAASNLLINQFAHWDHKDRDGLKQWINSITVPFVREMGLEISEDRTLSAVPINQQPRNPAALIAENKSPNDAQPGPWSPQQTRDAIAAFRHLSTDQKNKIFHDAARHSEDPFEPDSSNFSPPFLAEVHHDRLANPLPDDKSLNPDIVTFAQNWSSTEPAKAAAWASNLPPGPTRDWALKNVARTWQSYSENETQTWLNSLPADDQTTLSTYLKSHSNE